MVEKGGKGRNGRKGGDSGLGWEVGRVAGKFVKPGSGFCDPDFFKYRLIDLAEYFLYF